MKKLTHWETLRTSALAKLDRIFVLKVNDSPNLRKLCQTTRRRRYADWLDWRRIQLENIHKRKKLEAQIAYYDVRIAAIKGRTAFDIIRGSGPGY